jgi:hypothetical protein
MCPGMSLQGVCPSLRQEEAPPEWMEPLAKSRGFVLNLRCLGSGHRGGGMEPRVAAEATVPAMLEGHLDRRECARYGESASRPVVPARGALQGSVRWHILPPGEWLYLPG